MSASIKTDWFVTSRILEKPVNVVYSNDYIDLDDIDSDIDKDTLHAAECIIKIPKELVRNEEYTLILLDSVSFFNNVALQKILHHVYNQKLIKII